MQSISMAYCYRCSLVCLSVYLLDTTVSHAKTDKTDQDAVCVVLGWDPDLPRRKDSVGGMSHLVIKYIGRIRSHVRKPLS